MWFCGISRDCKGRAAFLAADAQFILVTYTEMVAVHTCVPAPAEIFGPGLFERFRTEENVRSVRHLHACRTQGRRGKVGGQRPLTRDNANTMASFTW